MLFDHVHPLFLRERQSLGRGAQKHNVYSLAASRLLSESEGVELNKSFGVKQTETGKKGNGTGGIVGGGRRK